MPEPPILPLPTVLAPLLPAGHQANIEYIRATGRPGRTRIILESSDGAKGQISVLSMRGEFRGKAHQEANSRAIASAVAEWASNAFTAMEDDGVVRFVFMPTPLDAIVNTQAAPCDAHRLARRIIDAGLRAPAIRAALVERTMTGAMAVWWDRTLTVQVTPPNSREMDALVDPAIRPVAEDWMSQHAGFLSGFAQISVSARFPTSGHALMRAAARAAAQEPC